MPKFRVLSGRHCEGDRDPVTNKLIIYNQGEVFESKTDLDKRFNHPTGVKFERVSDATVVSRAPLAQAAAAGFNSAEGAKKGTQPAFTSNDLEVMTLDELKKLAAEEEVDLGGLTKKADIIARIQSAVLV